MAPDGGSDTAPAALFVTVVVERDVCRWYSEMGILCSISAVFCRTVGRGRPGLEVQFFFFTFLNLGNLHFLKNRIPLGQILCPKT